MKSNLHNAIVAFGTDYGNPTPPPATTTTVGKAHDPLPFTGADINTTAAIGTGLLVLGALLAAVAYKRRSA